MNKYTHEVRSAMRKHEAAARRLRKSGVLLDAHVAVFMERYPTALSRVIAECKWCGSRLRRCEFPRNEGDGQLKRHCGCRTGVPSRKDTGKFRGVSSKAEYQRLQRSVAARGYRPIKHQEHVRQYRLHLARVERDQKLAMQRERLQKRADFRVMDPELQRQAYRDATNRLTRELSDGYVSKRLKKNMPLLKGVKLPKPLIDLERQRLMIVREVRERSKK